MMHSSLGSKGAAARLALAVAFTCAAGAADAAKLSGTIRDTGSGTGKYYVYVVRLSLDTPVVGNDILTTPGAWEVRNVPDGSYFIFAWRDLNANFIPSRGEPVGYYGDPFPQMVTVSGSNVGGLDIELQPINLGAEIVGRVSYSGPKTGRVWIVPHVTPDLTLLNVRGTPWTITSVPDDYQVYVLLDDTYYVTAFMDVNGNMIHDLGEPIGTSKAVNVVVTPGVTYSNVDIAMAVNATGVESGTWTEIKQLWR